MSMLDGKVGQFDDLSKGPEIKKIWYSSCYCRDNTIKEIINIFGPLDKKFFNEHEITDDKILEIKELIPNCVYAQIVQKLKNFQNNGYNIELLYQKFILPYIFDVYKIYTENLQTFISKYQCLVGEKTDISKLENVISFLGEITFPIRGWKSDMFRNFIMLIQNTSYWEKFINSIYKILETQKQWKLILDNYVGHFDAVIDENDLFYKLYDEGERRLIVRYLEVFKVNNEEKKEKIEECLSQAKRCYNWGDILNIT